MAKGKSPKYIIILLLVGALFGSILGQLMAGYAPFLNVGGRIGIDGPVVFRFAGILTLVFGLTLKVNLATVLGMVLAAFIAMRIGL